LSTLQIMAQAVRLRTDEPSPNRPSNRRILQAVTDSTQSLYNRLENTGQAWSLKQDYQLNVSSNAGDYLLAIDASYGKPIQVLTYYPQNPSYIQRYVDFTEFQDLNFNWPYPVNISSWMYTDGSNCTAMRMAFYYKDDGSRWVRVLPQPQLNAQYLITFASGDWVSSAGLEDSPVLSQFHMLAEIWAAESVLPSCQWMADQRYNMDHRREIALALKNDESRITDEFERYCRNLVDDRMGIRVSSFDGDVYGMGGW
jgi:hypothetical protein